MAQAQTHWDIETLIVGATFAGIGLASGTRAGALIVDREITVGHEFLYAFKHGENWRADGCGRFAAAFRGELVERGLLTAEGRAHLGGVIPALYRLTRDAKLPVRFLTELANVEPLDGEAGGYAVTLFDQSGFRDLRVRRIVDTTSTCLSKPGFAPAAGVPKRVNALLHAAAADAARLPIEADGWRVEPGRYDSEAYLSLPVSPQDDWTAARAKLHAFWAAKPEALQGWTLAVVADQFDATPPPGPMRIGRDWTWLPSAAFPQPLAALDAEASFSEWGNAV
ncbi:hypothetical protein [Paenibacillus antri]|uniref:hypothetical protein n=1 Tax=Paenibacillus antri TaxID=2582848 RepID=UPI0013053229|nr:hypothetical protein [Paenibacillus antri]